MTKKKKSEEFIGKSTTVSKSRGSSTSVVNEDGSVTSSGESVTTSTTTAKVTKTGDAT